MMKQIITTALLLSSLSIAAQETYQNAEVITEDLNGDARYVGMGGAMEALGADISAAGQNPAAIGLFRSSNATVSFGFTQAPNGGNNNGDGKTNINFDQLGFVVTSRSGYNSYLNWGINYRKTNNFNQLLDLVGRPKSYNFDGKQYNGSQHTVSYEKANSSLSDLAFSQVDYLYTKSLMKTDDGSNDYGCYSSDLYKLSRDRRGWTSNFDFMLGGNEKDRFYWGLSATIANVNYTNNTFYTESLLDNGQSIGNVELSDEHKITGVGVNFKGGIIFRPVEGDPFRIGLSIETPTWYSLKTENNCSLYNGSQRGDGQGKYVNNGETYEYELATPWKFGLSAGTTISNMLAIGATINYADYSSTKSRIKDGGHYDWWTDSYYSNSHNDKVMNSHTEQTLKGVCTVKVGAELHVTPALALRAGYNYVSPMYKTTATRNYTLDSPGTYYSATTDFTNWKATNRFTLGLGYSMDSFSIDLAYQHSATNGDFSPYYYEGSSKNSAGTVDNYTIAAEPLSIKKQSNQLICTLGYRF